MNKPFKTLSTAALAAVFASSALVPVASAEVAPAQAASLSKIIVEYNGQNVALTVSDYSDLLDAGKINPATVKYVELSTGDKYTLDAYSEALDALSNVEDTAEYLAEKGTPSEVKDVKDGTIKDGEIQVEDGTPEEKVNETFFYNLAA